MSLKKNSPKYTRITKSYRTVSNKVTLVQNTIRRSTCKGEVRDMTKDKGEKQNPYLQTNRLRGKTRYQCMPQPLVTTINQERRIGQKSCFNTLTNGTDQQYIRHTM